MWTTLKYTRQSQQIHPKVGLCNEQIYCEKSKVSLLTKKDMEAQIQFARLYFNKL